MLSNALIAKLKAKDDLRYHLTWAYGSFLEDIPQRIGTNEALDTAVDALVCAHSRFGVAGRAAANHPESLNKYTHAVGTLRRSLDDPVKARQTNTLAAVLLLMMCQLFLGTYVDRYTGHTEGAAIILKTRGYGNPEDEFERRLILTLRGPVLFESLYNSRISFTDEEWKLLVKNPLDGMLPRGDMMYSLAHVPDLMRRGRIALSTNSSTQGLIYETRRHYSTLKTTVRKLQKEYESTKLPTTKLAIRIHAHHQRMLGLGLAITLIFHSLLKGLCDAGADLNFDAEYYCDAVLDLSVHAVAFRPLGSSYIMLCLTTACVAAEDDAMKEMLIERFEEYQNDFPFPTSCMEWRAELERTRRRLMLQED